MRVAAFLAVGLGLAVVSIVWAQRRASARRERLKRIGRRLGLSHRERDPDVPGEILGALPEFRRGGSRRATSILSGEHEGREVLVFDWAYSTSTGNSQKRHRMTMVAFHRPDAPFPAFHLSPENVLHRIGAALGRQDIDFENDSEFSGGCFLQGEDEAAVRDLFERPVRREFVRHPGWYAQADGEWIVFWRSRRPRPDDLGRYIGEAARFVQRFDGE